MTKPMQWFLAGVLAMASIATIALVTTLALCRRDWRTVDHCLVSAPSVGYLLTASLVGSLAARKGGIGWAALAGIGLSLLLALALPAFIWFGEDYLANLGVYTLEEDVGRSLGTGLVAVGLLCLGPLIMKPDMKLAGRLIQWGTLASLLGAAAAMTACIWGSRFLEQDLEIVLYVALILSGAGTLCVWTVHRLTTLRAAIDLTLTGSVHLWCPRCRKEQDVPTRDARCPGCRLRFHIDVEEPVCLKCGYRLYGNVQRCPECGTSTENAAAHEPTTVSTSLCT